MLLNFIMIIFCSVMYTVWRIIVFSFGIFSLKTSAFHFFMFEYTKHNINLWIHVPHSDIIFNFALIFLVYIPPTQSYFIRFYRISLISAVNHPQLRAKGSLSSSKKYHRFVSPKYKYGVWRENEVCEGSFLMTAIRMIKNKNGWIFVFLEKFKLIVE